MTSVYNRFYSLDYYWYVANYWFLCQRKQILKIINSWNKSYFLFQFILVYFEFFDLRDLLLFGVFESAGIAGHSNIWLSSFDRLVSKRFMSSGCRWYFDSFSTLTKATTFSGSASGFGQYFWKSENFQDFLFNELPLFSSPLVLSKLLPSLLCCLRRYIYHMG